MSHKLLRFTDSLFSQPLLMTKESCEEVANYLDKRNAASLKDLSEIATADIGGLLDTTKDVSNVSGVGIIKVAGPISTYKTGFEALCQNTSYESIIEQAESFSKDESIHTVVLDLRSGGGMAHKAFEMSKLLKDTIEGSGKRLVSYVDQMAASAAYILASVGEEVIINPTASAGSIGVLIELTNNSKQLEKEGIERKFVTSSDGKIPFAEDGSFREGFLEDLQTSVDSLYKDFIFHVITYRGMDEKTIRATNAGVYSSEKSLELGLVDKIMTTKEFYNYIAETSSAKTNTHQKEVTMSAKDNTPEEATVDFAAELAEMKAKFAQQEAQLANYQQAEAQAATEALSTKLDGFEFAAEHKEALMGFFAGAEESQQTLMNAVLTSANTAMASMSTEHVKTLATKEQELSTVKDDLEKVKTEADAKVTAAAAASEEIKEEFAVTEFSVKAEVETPTATKGPDKSALQAFIKEQNNIK